jgi:hypothetical protein
MERIEKFEQIKALFGPPLLLSFGQIARKLKMKTSEVRALMRDPAIREKQIEAIRSGNVPGSKRPKPRPWSEKGGNSSTKDAGGHVVYYGGRYGQKG